LFIHYVGICVIIVLVGYALELKWNPWNFEALNHWSWNLNVAFVLILFVPASGDELFLKWRNLMSRN
jgi:hypothetical protein